jgi:hypothetical protein
MVASIVKSPSAHSIFPAQIEDHRVIGLNSRPRLYHEIATGPSAWSSGEPKSSETGLPGATTAATRGRATQLMPCGTSDIRTCSIAIAIATQSRMSIWAYILVGTSSGGCVRQQEASEALR